MSSISLFAQDDIIDHTDGNMDAHGNPIAYQGTRIVCFKAGMSVHTLHMNVSQSASAPIISLVSLLRSGAEMHTVSPVVPPCQATGQIVAGLRLEGMATWIPVLMDNMHLWLLMDQSGSLLTQELSPISSGGDRMECEADTQILLDSGANLHVCPRDFSPPGSTDHHISFFNQPSAVNVQGHRDRLDTEREIRLHMGVLDFTYYNIRVGHHTQHHYIHGVVVGCRCRCAFPGDG